MDISEIETFLAQTQSVSFEPDEPLFKIYLIRSRHSDTLYLVFKLLHSVCDGLDLLQMLSLMQDDKAARLSNAI